MVSRNGAPIGVQNNKDSRVHGRLGFKPVQTVAVTGGKGGVGKTTVAVNLATACAQAGKRVMLLDGGFPKMAQSGLWIASSAFSAGTSSLGS